MFSDFSCYQLFLRCTSEDGNTVRKLLMTRRDVTKNDTWIRNIADTIIQKQTEKILRQMLALSVLSTLIKFAPPFRSVDNIMLKMSLQTDRTEDPA